jgi:hypothetical protein
MKPFNLDDGPVGAWVVYCGCGCGYPKVTHADSVDRTYIQAWITDALISDQALEYGGKKEFLTIDELMKEAANEDWGIVIVGAKEDGRAIYVEPDSPGLLKLKSR